MTKCKNCKKGKEKVTKTGLNIGYCDSCISMESYRRRKAREIKKVYCQKCGKETKEYVEVDAGIQGKLKYCVVCN